MDEDLLLSAEAAAMCRKTPGTMRYLRHVGEGPRSFKLGRRVVYKRVDVEKWIEEQYNAQERVHRRSP